jgi:hypothetical protein
MNHALNEVNRLYLEIQNSIDPAPGYLDQLTAQERAAYMQRLDAAKQIYHLALDKLRAVVSQLSLDEMIEGYTYGCRLLQRSLSGYMGRQFNVAYIPLMITSIRAGHVHTAETFLQVLADQLGKAAAPIVIESLDSQAPGIRQKALLVIEQLHLVEALPKVQALIRDPVKETALLAKQVLQRLEGMSI